MRRITFLVSLMLVICLGIVSSLSRCSDTLTGHRKPKYITVYYGFTLKRCQTTYYSQDNVHFKTCRPTTTQVKSSSRFTRENFKIQFICVHNNNNNNNDFLIHNTKTENPLKLLPMLKIYICTFSVLIHSVYISFCQTNFS